MQLSLYFFNQFYFYNKNRITDLANNAFNSINPRSQIVSEVYVNSENDEDMITDLL